MCEKTTSYYDMIVVLHYVITPSISPPALGQGKFSFGVALPLPSARPPRWPEP